MKVHTDKWQAEQKLRLKEPIRQAFLGTKMPKMETLDVEVTWFAKWRDPNDVPGIEDFIELRNEISKVDPANVNRILVDAFPKPGTLVFGMELV